MDSRFFVYLHILVTHPDGHSHDEWCWISQPRSAYNDFRGEGRDAVLLFVDLVLHGTHLHHRAVQLHADLGRRHMCGARVYELVGQRRDAKLC